MLEEEIQKVANQIFSNARTGVRGAGAIVWTTHNANALRIPVPVPPPGPTIPTVMTIPYRFTATITLAKGLLPPDDMDESLINAMARTIGGALTRSLMSQVDHETLFGEKKYEGSPGERGLLSSPLPECVVDLTKGDDRLLCDLQAVMHLAGNYSPMKLTDVKAWLMHKSTFQEAHQHSTRRATGDTASGRDQDTLFGYPVFHSPHMPTLNDPHGIVAVFGNFQDGYLIRDVGEITIAQSTNSVETTFSATFHTDGRVADPKMFAYLRVGE